MSEIVGGLNIREVAEGGAVFEIKHEVPKEDKEDEDYVDAVSSFTKMECLDYGQSVDAGEPFKNLAKKMVNLLENGKIKKRILRKGYGPKPENLSNVKINYNAYVQFEAHPFDSTYARKKPFSFIVGEGQVIEGLDIAVQSMQLNEKAQFLIESELAYRNSGFNRVPPNSDVLFEIELGEILESGCDDCNKTDENEFEHVYTRCLALCVRGKSMFRSMDYQGAIKEYKLAVCKLEKAHLKDYDEEMKCEELLVRLFTNLLICDTHLQLPKKGCICAQKIYEMAKNKTFKISAKVYFNHAKCLRMLGNFDNASRKLSQARQLEPRNPEIFQEFEALKKAKEEYKKKQTSFGKALVSS